jgi:hypothetical protein
MKRAREVAWTLPWNYGPAENTDRALPTIASRGLVHTLNEKVAGDFYRILGGSVNVTWQRLLSVFR